MRGRPLIWVGLAIVLAAGAIAAYVWFLRTPSDPVASAERIDLCEAITQAALETPPAYRRLHALEMKQLVIMPVVAIAFHTTDAPPTGVDVAVCIFANPFNGTYGRPRMIRATLRGRPVAQSLVDAVAARWAAGKH
jgi:hypothetical protein